MNRNVEIKARITESLESLLSCVEAIADHGPTEIFQDDTFFNCPNGRLKLRTFSGTEGELIFYQRSDGTEPKESEYVIAETAAPDSLREVLKLAYGDAGRVRKVRTLFLVGRTRVHIDRVEGLGNFLELEVVLAEGEPVEPGVAVAHELLEKLGLSSQQLVAKAYVDLLAPGQAVPRGATRNRIIRKVGYCEALYDIRPFLDGARPRNRFDHDVVVAGFIYSEGLALVARRALSKSTAPGQLHLPGGHVEVGEYPVAALRREIEEEFGVQVQVEEPLYAFEYYVENKHHTLLAFEYGGNKHHTFGIVYAAHLEGPITALRLDPLDNSEILWVGREELDQLFPDKTNHNYLAAVEGFAYMQDQAICDGADQ